MPAQAPPNVPPPPPVAPDPLDALLARSPLPTAVQSRVWDLYEAADSPKALEAVLRPLRLHASVLKPLLALKRQETEVIGPDRAEESPAPPGGIRRFAAEAWEGLNPVSIVSGIATAAGSPIQTARADHEARMRQFDEAGRAWAEGRLAEAVGHGVAGMVPLVGPAAAEGGERIAAGDVAGGLGLGVGMITSPIGAATWLGRAGTAARQAARAGRAGRLMREAEQIVSERVLAPANPAYRRAAQEAAPALLKRGVRGDRIALQTWADELVASGEQQISRILAESPSATGATKPIVQALTDAMHRLSFAGPLGTPAPVAVNPMRRAYWQQLSTLTQFVQERGPRMKLVDLWRLRQQLDEVAEQAGKYAQASGDMSVGAVGDAAYEAANAIRRQLVAERPALAAANADMHLGLAVRDILNPAKGRPKTAAVTTGATGGLHTTAAIIGHGMAREPGLRALTAFLASDLIPRIKNAQVSPANQLRIAQRKYALAQALQRGDLRAAQRAVVGLSAIVPGAARGLNEALRAYENEEEMPAEEETPESWP